MTLPAGLTKNAFLPKNALAELDLKLPVGGGAGKRLAKAVQERLCLGGFATPVDGDFGAATTESLRNFQQHAGLAVTGSYDTSEHDRLSAPFVGALNPPARPAGGLGPTIVVVARQHIAQKPIEVGGQNRGPWVRLYMDGNDGDEFLWCAGFCFFIIAQACAILGTTPPMQKTFGVDVIAERAKASGLFLSEAAARTPANRARIVPGSLFMVRRTPISYSHVGIVTTVNADSFGTCEGNSNEGGSSNGFEALQRVRSFDGKDFVIW